MAPKIEDEEIPPDLCDRSQIAAAVFFIFTRDVDPLHCMILYRRFGFLNVDRRQMFADHSVRK